VLVPDEIKDCQDKTFKHITAMAKKKNKSYHEKELLTLSQQALYQAGYVTAAGFCQLALAGAEATTAAVIKAGLATIPMRSGLRSLSSSFLMVRKEELLLFADCGVIVEPTAEQLADIAAASCQTWRALHGTLPRVAFLSFATLGSAHHASLETLRRGLALFKERCPEVEADGELQFDAAYVAEVGARKAPHSPVAGKAQVLVFPNLAAGNIAYKIAERLGGFAAYGPLLQGFTHRYSDLSRGCSVKDIVMSVGINLLLA
jgi:phosphate acetyltransferase